MQTLGGGTVPKADRRFPSFTEGSAELQVEHMGFQESEVAVSSMTYSSETAMRFLQRSESAPLVVGTVGTHRR